MANNIVGLGQQTNNQDFLSDWGFQDAGSNMGEPSSLKGCLGKVEMYVIDNLKSMRGDYQAKIDELERQNAVLNTEADKLKKEIKDKKADISKLKIEIEEIPNNPKKYEIETQFNPIGFNVSSILIILLTLYLVLFYASAAYSALYKDFSSELGNAAGTSADIKILFRSIFDPNAFRDAINEGPAVFAFILLVPSIFLSAGYAIHLVAKRIYKAAIIGVVLFADTAIAYKISKEIYVAKSLTGQVDEEWKAIMALQDVNFYLVIIAGFAAYIVWGVLLDYVVKQYEESRPLIAARKRRVAQIKALEGEIKETDGKLAVVDKQLTAKKDSIAELRKSLNAKITSYAEMYTTLDAYFSGWTSWCNSSNKANPAIAGALVKEASVALEKFKQELPRRYKRTDVVKEVIDK